MVVKDVTPPSSALAGLLIPKLMLIYDTRGPAKYNYTMIQYGATFYSPDVHKNKHSIIGKCSTGFIH